MATNASRRLSNGFNPGATRDLSAEDGKRSVVERAQARQLFDVIGFVSLELWLISMCKQGGLQDRSLI